MKKPLLILVLVHCITLYGQSYHPFPLTNASWNIYLLSSCSEDMPPMPSLMRFTLRGDTILNDKTYHNLFSEKGDTASPEITFWGGIREEGKKVYYTGPGYLGDYSYGVEFLLYDFSLQAGDTIEHLPGNEYMTSVILSVDSVLICNEYRKRFFVESRPYFHNPDEIIEGIGSVRNGLLGGISSIPTCGYHYWEQVCFSENGEVVYLNPEFEDCYSYEKITPPVPYQSMFPTDTTRWNVYECVADAGGTIAYYSLSDTIMNDLLYHKIFRSPLYSSEQNPFTSKSILGYIREEPLTGKTWFSADGKGDQDEILIMDLNLKQGESFVQVWPYDGHEPDSLVVDSIYYSDVRKVIRFRNFRGMCLHGALVFFVEGVGPTYGFPDIYLPYSNYGISLLCKYDDSKHAYSPEDWPFDCYMPGGGGINNSTMDDLINIYPNPSSEEIQISKTRPFSNETILIIYNAHGQKLLTKEFSSEKEILQINKPGLYFVTIMNGTRVVSKKIMITGH
ncbi:MAG: T9SS type A sorting domain-containing protein [Bacteroidales bacterium]